MHGVLGLHRHVVRLVETVDVSYVVKELPDDLALASTGCCASSTRNVCRPPRWSRS